DHLSERGRELLSNQPPHHVHRPAGECGDDELDRPARIFVLRLRRRRERGREQSGKQHRAVLKFHSGFTPASLAIACHFGISLRMNAVKSSGVPGCARAPSLWKRSCISAELRPALSSALSRSTSSLGVSAGAISPVQELATKSGTPASVMVATCGNSGSRAGVATPSAL